MVSDEELNKITQSIIGSAFTVHNTLGVGFLEKVYENALYYELVNRGLVCEQQAPIKIYYADIVVGDYIADLIVNRLIIVEIMANRSIDNIHFAQCINYLKGSRLPLALLINFGNPRVEVKRFRNSQDEKDNDKTF